MKDNSLLSRTYDPFTDTKLMIAVFVGMGTGLFLDSEIGRQLMDCAFENANDTYIQAKEAIRQGFHYFY